MKKLLCLLLALLCLSCSLFSCESEKPSAAEAEFSPLFRFQIKEASWRETRVFFCPRSQGFLYLHPSEEGGTGGFVSPERSFSGEGLIQGVGDLSLISVREPAKDRFMVLSEKGLFTFFGSGGNVKTTLPEDFSFAQSTMFYDDLSVLSVRDGLILLSPIDFKETYVLASAAGLPDFASLITVSQNGKRIWYAKGEKGNYTGFAFFEYGANLPLGEEAFSFSSFQALGEGKILFTSLLSDGGALYLYRDLESGKTASVLVDTPFQAVSADPEGKRLCGMIAGETEGKLHFFDLESGKEKGIHTVNYGTPAAIALSADGKTLFLAVGSGNDEIFGTLDLSVYF